MTTVETIHERGYVVLPELLSRRQLDTIKSQLQPHLDAGHFGRNDFEGFRTQRLYALLAKAPAVAELVAHRAVLAIVDELLHPAYLLSAALAINVHPGETAQLLHADDAYCAIPRPRRAVGVSAIWAIDDFTTHNGATEIVPGSHLWQETDVAVDDPRIVTLAMAAGSVVVFLGTTLHRGGANRSQATRLAITPQYCEPWIRQIENMALAVPPETARGYSEWVQELLGYDIFEPTFIGYVDGMHPKRLLDPGYATRRRPSRLVLPE